VKLPGVVLSVYLVKEIHQLGIVFQVLVSKFVGGHLFVLQNGAAAVAAAAVVEFMGGGYGGVIMVVGVSVS
jgi:hypothetical protein